MSNFYATTVRRECPPIRVIVRWIGEGASKLFPPGELSAWFAAIRFGCSRASPEGGDAKNVRAGNFQKSICEEKRLRYSQVRGFDHAGERPAHIEAQQVSPTSAWEKDQIYGLAFQRLSSLSHGRLRRYLTVF